jgi:hypothetical protein
VEGWGVAQAAEFLPNKCKALSSNSNTTKKIHTVIFQDYNIIKYFIMISI